MENTKRRRNLSPAEKEISILLIQEDVTIGEVANYHGHHISNASTRKLRGDKNYFMEAIRGIRGTRPTAHAS